MVFARPFMRRAALVLLLLLAVGSGLATAGDFDVLASTPRLQALFDELRQGPDLPWPASVRTALTARALAQRFPAPRYEVTGPLLLEVDAEPPLPLGELDVVVVDTQAQDHLVLAAVIGLPPRPSLLSTTSAALRERLAALRAALIEHRRDTLVARNPAAGGAVAALVRPDEALPELVAVGGRRGRDLFDLNLPVDAGEDALLYRTLLHREHPEDAAVVAATPHLAEQFTVLRAADEPIKVVGQVLEVLSRHDLAATEFPAPAYRVTGGLEYRRGVGSPTLGELDILVVRQADHKVVLIGEAKLSRGDSFIKALEKAKTQMARIRGHLEGADADELVFTYLPDPTEPFTIDDFRGAATTYRIFGSRGSLAYGFDREIDLDRDHGDLLFREARLLADDGKDVVAVMSMGSHRRFFALRAAAVAERARLDAASGVVYGERSEAMAAFHPAISAAVAGAPSLADAVATLVRRGEAWHEIAEVLRNHDAGVRLLDALELPQANTLLYEAGCPLASAAAILAAHRDAPRGGGH